MRSFAGKTVLVTGGTAGIGLAVCELFSSLGASVACMARHRSEKFFSVCADVSDEQSVRRATAEVAEKFGGIDVLVCNAGFGISGSAECTAAEDVLRLFEVNFLGVHNAVRAALPYMRGRGGHIITVSSVAALLPIPYQSYYSASKAAVSSFSAALKNEVAPFGVKVCAVLPGDVKTGFTSARKKNADDGVYAPRAERAVGAMERDEQGGMPPQAVARAVARQAARKNPPVQVVVGAKYKLFALLAKLLPRRLVNYILGRLY